MIRVATLAALGLALVATRSDPLAGRIAGKPQQCIDLSRNTSPDIVDARTILYRETNRRIWKTGPVGACASLRPLTTLIVDVYGNHLCSGDRFRTIDSTTSIPSGYCRFDSFTPYDLPAR